MVGKEKRSKKGSLNSDPNGEEKELKGLVYSKIEHTTSPTPIATPIPPNLSDNAREKVETGKEKIVVSLHKYRTSLKDIGKHVAEEAVRMAEGNLLSAKLGLWEGVKVVEDKLKENKV